MPYYIYALDFQFGSDIYLITDGEPAPLLHSPSSFHKLVAPLPASHDKVRFQWNSFVRDEHQVLKLNKKIVFHLNIFHHPLHIFKRYQILLGRWCYYQQYAGVVRKRWTYQPMLMLNKVSKDHSLVAKADIASSL